MPKKTKKNGFHIIFSIFAVELLLTKFIAYDEKIAQII